MLQISFMFRLLDLLQLFSVSLLLTSFISFRNIVPALCLFFFLFNISVTMLDVHAHSFCSVFSLSPPSPLCLSTFPPPLPPALLLLGNPLYDLLLLTSCHMTSGWLRGKSWKVWLQTCKTSVRCRRPDSERRGRLVFSELLLRSSACTLYSLSSVYCTVSPIFSV